MIAIFRYIIFKIIFYCYLLNSLNDKLHNKKLKSGENMKRMNLSIFGDNILECERMFELISSSFPELACKKQELNPIYAPKKKHI